MQHRERHDAGNFAAFAPGTSTDTSNRFRLALDLLTFLARLTERHL